MQLANGILAVVVNVPESAYNKTSGLLGVFNGDPDDDLTAPDGTVLSPDSDMETIYYDFGQLCELWRVSHWLQLVI